jgi:predicted nucleotide-binding protein
MSEPKFKVVENGSSPAQIEGAETKRKRRANRPIPPVKLQDALPVARSIADNNAGKAYSRLSIADTLQRSPDSTGFRDMITASGQYGLTKGSYRAPQIAMTELGKAIVMPKNDSEVRSNLQSAFLAIPLYKRLASHFDGNRIPQEQHFRNTLIRDFDIDPDWATQTVQDFVANAKFVGLVRTISGVDRIDLSGALESGGVSTTTFESEEPEEEPEEALPSDIEEPSDTGPGTQQSALHVANRVFITHGKNTEIVNQLKEILRFGKFAPIVAEEEETTSRPVPDKVLSSMRTCFAGVIHIEDERDVMDQEGTQYQLLNQNVLIEIGAAMALYGYEFVLLVKRGVNLPSNLQGLYRCDYEGDKLDYEATMKLLRTFNSFGQ